MQLNTLGMATEIIKAVSLTGCVSVEVGNNYCTLFNRVRQVSYEKMIDVDITVESGVMTVTKRTKDKP